MLPEIIEHADVRVLTSAQLAESFGSDGKTINRNFQRNQDQFEQGVHYFSLTGEALKAFKGVRQNDVSLKFVSVLYLWTEKGAWLHAKFSNGERAKEAYQGLINSYYSILEQPQQEQPLAISYEQFLAIESRVEALEQRLSEVTLHSGEQLRLRKAVTERVYQLTENKGARRTLFRALYSAIKERYSVGSYRDVKQHELQDALRFVATWGGDASCNF